MEVVTTGLLAEGRSHLGGSRGLPFNGPRQGQPGSDLFSDLSIWPSANPAHALIRTRNPLGEAGAIRARGRLFIRSSS